MSGKWIEATPLSNIAKKCDGYRRFPLERILGSCLPLPLESRLKETSHNLYGHKRIGCRDDSHTVKESWE